MVECLVNLVGVKKPCDDDTPSTSGYYLQNLDYIDFSTADAIIKNDMSAEEYLQRKLDFATNYLSTDFQTKLGQKFIQWTVLEKTVAGFYQQNKQSIPGIAGMLKGIQLEVLQFPFLQLYLSSLTLFVDFTGNLPVHIFDLTQGKLLDTITVPAIAGETVMIDVSKSYPTNGQALNIFIGYDSGLANGYNTTVYQNSISGCRRCPGSTRPENKYVWVFAKKLPIAGPKIDQNTQSVNDTGGLSINYSLQCSVTGFLCSIKNQLALPLLYRAGYEILMDALTSTRKNPLVLLQKDEMATLTSYYDEQYDKAITNLLQNLRIPNDICFTCKPKVSTTTIST